MSKLKALLGEAYKEDLTLEDIEGLLADRDIVDKASLGKVVKKDQFDKVASELAAANKQLKELEELSMTDAEKVAMAIQEKDNVIQTLQKDIMRSRAKEKLAKAGYGDSDDLVEKVISKGKFENPDDIHEVIDEMINTIKAVEESTEKRVKEAKMLDTPTPPAGTPPSQREAFDKMNVTERMIFKAQHPEEYKIMMGAGEE